MMKKNVTVGSDLVNIQPILFNGQLDAQFLFYVFISVLYMFRAFKRSSSGDAIVSIRYMVYVSLCR